MAGMAYYVSTHGNDNNDGTSTNTPFRTIQKAATISVAGDTVLCEDVRIEDCQKHYMIVLRTDHPERPSTGQISNVTFRNVRRIGGPQRPSYVSGGPNGWVREVFFESLFDDNQQVINAETGHFTLGKNLERVTFGMKSPQVAVVPARPRAAMKVGTTK
jgi:hypothetical protein